MSITQPPTDASSAETLANPASGVNIASIEGGVFGPAPTDVVREFWRLMATNDFHDVAAILAPEFVLEWPQSRERIRGAERFARMNEEYPAHGRWEFAIHRMVGDETQAVSDVTVTDGVQTARAISFFTVVQGKITRLIEFWPEPYAAPEHRAHLVEIME